MSDFNLMAEIDVQLATGAGASLVSQLENVFKTQKGKTKNEISVPVKLTGAAAAIAKLKADLAGFTDKSFKLEVDIPNSTLTKLDSLHSKIKSVSDALNAFGAQTSPAKVLKALADDNILKKVEKSTKVASDAGAKSIDGLTKRVRGFLKLGNTGEFLPFVKKEVNDLIKSLSSVNSLSKDAKESLFARFQGIGGNSGDRNIRNLVGALEEAFRATKNLDTEAAKLNARGLLTPEITAQFNEAKKGALELLKTLDASNTTAFRSQLEGVTKPFLTSVRTALTEGKSYRALLRSIARDEATALARGGEGAAATLQSIRAKRTKAEELKAKGLTTEQIRQDPAFLATEGINTNIKESARLAEQSLRKLDKAAADILISDIYKSAGAQAIDLAGQTTALIDSNRKKIQEALKLGDSAARESIGRATDDLANRTTQLRGRAKEIDGILLNLFKKQSYYENSGLQQSAQKTTDLIAEISRLSRQGIGTDQLTKSFNEQGAAIEAFSKNETKLSRYVDVINRLKDSLEINIMGGDRTGVGATLDRLDKDVRGTNLNNFDDEALKRTISKGNIEARFRANINKEVQRTFDKFDEKIFTTADDSQINKAFSAGRVEFEKLINSLDLGKASLSELAANQLKVKEASDLAFSRASTQAAGGYFAKLSSAAGLAVKRLSAYLVAAQGLYTIQNILISTVGTVVALDTEFTKFEQIFAGSDKLVGSVADNVTNLSSKILKLGSDYGVASKEIAESAGILAQADIRGPDLDQVLEVATKAKLGPTFKSNKEITEALIAVMNQFNLTAQDSANIIGGISQVSAQFAVESEGITAAVRRAGGAFASARGAGVSYREGLANFIGLFTVLKQTTREADETLATSLRNILTRLQRTNVQKFLTDRFQISFLDDEGQFVGPIKALERVKAKMEELAIQSTDPRYAEIVEKLAGARQSSRLNSVLDNLDDAQRVIGQFGKGGEILDRDLGIAFGSITNKIERAKNAVIELFTEVGRSETVKALIELFTTLTKVLTSLARSLDFFSISFLAFANMTPIIGQLKKLFSTVREFAFIGPGLVSQTFLDSRVSGFSRRNSGGLIPGDGPDVDSVPALLTKGEYVIRKRAVQKYGPDFLSRINRGHYNRGGLVGYNQGGSVDGIDRFIKSLSKLGLTITNLDKIISSVNFVDVIRNSLGSVIQGAAGLFNSRDKSLQIKSGSGGGLRLHELGHAISKALGSSGVDLGRIPENIKSKTIKDIERNPATYGVNPQGHVIQEEIRANFIKSGLQQTARGDTPDPYFREILVALKEKTGVSIRSNKRVFDDSNFSKNQELNASLSSPEVALKALFSPLTAIINDFKILGTYLGSSAKSAAQFTKSGILTFLNNIKIKGSQLLGPIGGFASGLGQRVSSGLSGAASKTSEFIGRAGGFQLKGLSNEFRNLRLKLDDIVLAGGAAGRSGIGKVKQLGTSISQSGVGRAVIAEFKLNKDDVTNVFSELKTKLTALATIIGSSTVGQSVSRRAQAIGSFGSSVASSVSGRVQQIGSAISSVPGRIASAVPLRAGGSVAPNIVAGSLGLAATVTKLGGSFIQLIKSMASVPAVVGLALTSLALIGNYSKDANDGLQVFVKALTSATVSLILYSQALKLANGKIPEFIKNLIPERLKGAARSAIPERLRGAVSSPKGFLERGSNFGAFRGGGGQRGGFGSGRFGGESSGRSALSGPSGSKSIFSLFKGFQLLTLVVTALTTAFNSVTDSAIELANKKISEATSSEEAIRALNERRKLESAKRGSSFVRGAAVGAGIGVTLGARGGPVGIIIGGLVGAFIGGLATMKKTVISLFTDSALFAPIRAIGTFIIDTFKGVYNGLVSFFNGVDAYIDSLKSETTKLQERRVRENEDRLVGADADILGFTTGKGLGEKGVNEKLQKAAKALDDFVIIDDDSRNLGAASAEKLKSTLEGLSAFERAGIVEEAKKQGVNIADIFKKFRIPYNAMGDAATIALNELTKIFVNMKDMSARLADTLGSFDIQNQVFDKAFRGLTGELDFSVPPEAFDILKNGGELTGEINGILEEQIKRFRQFSPEGAANLTGAITGARATRNVVSDIVNNDLAIDPGEGFTGLQEILIKKFAEQIEGTSNQGIEGQLNEMFDKFLNSKGTELTESLGSTIDTTKITGILDEFTSSLADSSGSVDAFRKYSDSNAKFAEQLNNITRKRIEIENKNVDLLISNADKTKSLGDILNKTKGLVGVGLQKVERQQAASADISTQQALGIGGNVEVSPQAILGRFRALQAREATGLADLRGGRSDSQSVRDLPAIQNAQDNMVKALERTANGTNSFRQAIEAFEKASERAKKRTEEFSGALLGTDDELLNRIKGEIAYQRIINAKDSGQAFQILQNMTEQERVALNAVRGRDEDKGFAIDRALNIGTDISATPEAARAQDEIQKQIDANNALISINQTLADRMTDVGKAMLANQKDLQNLGLQLNNFAGAAVNLANNLGEIPENIKHEHTFTVSPIQISFTGTENLTKLTPATQDAVTAIVNSEISKFANNLKNQNKGLTVQNIVGLT